MKTYDPAAAAKAQEAYCDAHEIPMFAPINCPRCGHGIYDPYPNPNLCYSVEDAGSKLITGCPYCHYSFVE